MNKETRIQNFIKLSNDIDKCISEEDLDKVMDIADEMLLAKHITKKAYKALEELLQERLSYLVDKNII